MPKEHSKIYEKYHDPHNKAETVPTLLWSSQLENKNMTEVSWWLNFGKKHRFTDVMVTKNYGPDFYMKIRFSIILKN